MDSHVLAVLVDKGITFLAGLLFTLLGFRVIGKKKDESVSYDQWCDTHGLTLRIIGPILMVIAVVLAVVRLNSQ